MSEVARTFARAAFDRIEFPFTEYTVKGSVRHHVHIYPHSPGGDDEALGRALYEIRFTADLHDTFVTYPGLFPDRLADLRTKYELQTVATLSIPAIGEIQARCIDWTEHYKASSLSGTRVEWTFLEQQDTSLLALGLSLGSLPVLASLMATFDGLALDAGIDLSLFDALRNAVNFVTSIGDQVELYANQVDAKVQGIMQMCEQLDRSAAFFSKGSNCRLLDTLHEIHGAATRVHDDSQKKSQPVVAYKTPTLMSITEACQAIFGSTKRTVELLRMNALDDALAIPQGSLLFHYPRAAT